MKFKIVLVYEQEFYLQVAWRLLVLHTKVGSTVVPTHY